MLGSLTKVFIILMVLLSLGLAVSSAALFAQRTDWFTKYVEEKDKVDDAVKQKEAAERDKEETVQKIQEKLDQEAALHEDTKVQKDKHKADWEAKATDYNRLNTKLEQVITTNDQHARNIDDLTEQNKRLNAEIGRVKKERDVANGEKIEAIQAAVQLEKLIEKQGNQLTAAHHQVKMLEGRIKELTGTTTAARLLEHRIEGVVTSITQGYIGISVGQEDHVKKGQEFAVYRGSEYVGRIRVIRVDRDVAVAKELPQWRYKRNREVKEGDTISNAI